MIGERAFSLIELLVSLFISSVILLTAFNVTATTLQSTLQIERRYSEIKTKLTLFTLLRQKMEAIDASIFSPAPTILSSEILKKSLPTLTGVHSPDIHSEAISFVSLFPHTLFQITTCSNEQDAPSCTVCRIGNSSFPEDTRSVAAISLYGFFEFKPPSPLPKYSGGARCSKFRLTSLTSLTLAKFQGEPLHLLIPIKAVSVYYLDRTGTLRYLSLVGNSVIENQPVMEGFSSLRFSASHTSLSEGHFLLTVTGKLKSGALFSFDLTHTLARSSPDSLILNLDGYEASF